MTKIIGEDGKTIVTDLPAEAVADLTPAPAEAKVEEPGTPAVEPSPAAAKQCLGKPRIPDFRTQRRECKAWSRRINKAATKINWQFDRKDARKAFGYDKNCFKR